MKATYHAKPFTLTLSLNVYIYVYRSNYTSFASLHCIIMTLAPSNRGWNFSNKSIVLQNPLHIEDPLQNSPFKHHQYHQIFDIKIQIILMLYLYIHLYNIHKYIINQQYHTIHQSLISVILKGQLFYKHEYISFKVIYNSLVRNLCFLLPPLSLLSLFVYIHIIYPFYSHRHSIGAGVENI